MHETKILAALRENYARCTSYEDAGIVKGSLIVNDSKDELVSEFSTIFIRPNLLKFVMKRPGHQSTLQADGESIRQIHINEDLQDGVSVYPSLSDAISTTRGVTSGVLSVLFGLLDSSIDDYYEALSNLERLPDAVIDDKECYCISGKFKEVGIVTIWVQKENNVLRRIQESTNEEAIKMALEISRLIAESEGEEPAQSLQYLPSACTTTIDFKQVTFNNSITIDAIG